MALEPWVETHGGRKFYFLNPTPEMIDIEDIAHSLAHQCRFGGHIDRFYSVAEHSVHVAMELCTHPRWVTLQGLLHDASEAYLLDVPSPIKQYLTNYKEMEEKIMKAIFTKFDIPWPMDEMVKEADAVMLKREAQILIPSKGVDWVDKYETLWETKRVLSCYPPKVAKETFKTWFNYLIKEVQNAERQETFV